MLERLNDDIYSYKVSNKDHLRLSSTSLFYLFVYLVCACAAFIFYPRKEADFVIFIGIILLLVFTGPAFYLHYLYFMKSQHQELRLHDDFFELFEEDVLKFKIQKKDIQNIHLFMSPTYIESGIARGVPFMEYNYMEIKTSTDTIQINNLLYPDLKHLALNFFDITPIYHQSYFANIE